MTTEEWLSRGRHLDKEIRQLKAARAAALARAESVTAWAADERVQTSARNASEDKFIKYADYVRKIDAKIGKLIEVQVEIQDVIERVDDARLRALLTARYVNCKTWETIADELGFDDVRQVYRVKKQAIAAVKQVIENMKFW